MLTPTGWTNDTRFARPEVTFFELRALVERMCGRCGFAGCRHCRMLRRAKEEARRTTLHHSRSPEGQQNV